MALPRLAAAVETDAVPGDVTAANDFDELWGTLASNYCFFGEKRTDWDKVRALYRPQALAAQSIEEFTGVVHAVLGELYDIHTHLKQTADGAPRWPLFDLMGEWHDGSARIISVAEDSAAARAAIRPGDEIVDVDGVSIATATLARRPRCLTEPHREANDYALNCVLAGHRARPRQMLIHRPGQGSRMVDLPLSNPAAGADSPADVEWRGLDDNLGYIAIRSFADDAVVAAFDAALLALRDTRGLIIDVRNNGGGDTAVARPIMGRFITERLPYARMRRRSGDGDRRALTAAWTEYVDPTGPFTYTRPVVVLTNYWSASMAEGFPMGMRGIGRAKVVGTPMMALGAAVFDLRLNRTGVDAQYSAEPVYDVRDQPRWTMRPDVEVATEADVLAEGIRVVSQMANG
ncbi:peptidase S41 [Altererythrobacter xixiisoli]|uniref:Peptidase S41 n=2 Tax=Croceibacterium xixiisoli TaxID=1476466 RepID=A0A6I4TTX6_9SPHN|nr:peptidase S41 [Croceibacterium xixiisoli]